MLHSKSRSSKSKLIYKLPYQKVEEELREIENYCNNIILRSQQRSLQISFLNELEYLIYHLENLGLSSSFEDMNSLIIMEMGIQIYEIININEKFIKIVTNLKKEKRKCINNI